MLETIKQARETNIKEKNDSVLNVPCPMYQKMISNDLAPFSNGISKESIDAARSR